MDLGIGHAIEDKHEFDMLEIFEAGQAFRREWIWFMSSVAIGPDGNVWTFHRGKIPVQVYTPDGRLVKYWGQDGLFKNPHTIRFDSAGNLWIADTGTQTVRKFTADGKVLM